MDLNPNKVLAQACEARLDFDRAIAMPMDRERRSTKDLVNFLPKAGFFLFETLEQAC